MTTFDIKFLSHNRKAVCAPDPAFPNGMDADLTNGAKLTCLAEIPYPAECCGVWIVKCETCGLHVGITATGRPDDVRTAKLACKRRETAGCEPSHPLGTPAGAAARLDQGTRLMADMIRDPGELLAAVVAAGREQGYPIEAYKTDRAWSLYVAGPLLSRGLIEGWRSMDGRWITLKPTPAGDALMASTRGPAS